MFKPCPTKTDKKGENSSERQDRGPSIELVDPPEVTVGGSHKFNLS